MCIRDSHSTDQRSKTARNRKSQSRAALCGIASRASVYLLKLLEDPTLVRRVNADSSIDYLDANPRIRRIRAPVDGSGSAIGEGIDEMSADDDSTFVRVLHRIPQQIHKYLPQMGRVGSDTRKTRTHYERQAQILLAHQRFLSLIHISEPT